MVRSLTLNIVRDRYFKNNSLEEMVEKQYRMNEFVKNLDNVTGSLHGISAPTYRVILPETNTFTGGEQWAENLGYVEGETITFKSFSSTSIDPRIVNLYIRDESEEQQAIVFRILSKTGAVVSTTEVNDNPSYVQDSEREVLLPRGKQYQVVKVSREAVYNIRETDEGWLIPVTPLTVDLVEL